MAKRSQGQDAPNKRVIWQNEIPVIYGVFVSSVYYDVIDAGR